MESLDGGWYRKVRFGQIVKGKSDGVYTCTETYQGYDHERVVYKRTIWNVIVIEPHTPFSTETGNRTHRLIIGCSNIFV